MYLRFARGWEKLRKVQSSLLCFVLVPEATVPFVGLALHIFSSVGCGQQVKLSFVLPKWSSHALHSAELKSIPGREMEDGRSQQPEKCVSSACTKYCYINLQ